MFMPMLPVVAPFCRYYTCINNNAATPTWSDGVKYQTIHSAFVIREQAHDELEQPIKQI